MQTVVVPAWRRPAFLLACLERLEVAVGGRRDIRFLIALDRGHTREVSNIAADFYRRRPAYTKVVRRQPHGYHGNSFNVLMSYREVLAPLGADDLVHLVEEDILVGHDYFDYHERAHGLVPNTFSVSACRNQNTALADDPPQDDTAIYGHPMYQSIGVSFRAHRLRKILPHLSRAYFSDMVGYCNRMWPASKIPKAHAEQDGLLHRISEANNLTTAYPLTPRAYHVGFTGYHRNGAELAGTTRQQADRLLSMTADELNAAAHSYPDHNTIPLDGHRDPVSQVVNLPQVKGNFV